MIVIGPDFRNVKKRFEGRIITHYHLCGQYSMAGVISHSEVMANVA